MEMTNVILLLFYLWQSSRSDSQTPPLHNLPKVISTGDILEEEAVRDLIFGLFIPVRALFSLLSEGDQNPIVMNVDGHSDNEEKDSWKGRGRMSQSGTGTETNLFGKGPNDNGMGIGNWRDTKNCLVVTVKVKLRIVS
jgi:hypothetical protein